MASYNYGSQPIEPYDYQCFVTHFAPNLPENDEVFLHDGLLNWRGNRDGMPLALFRNICHWKSPRPFHRVCSDTAREVNRKWQSALHHLDGTPLQTGGVVPALGELTQLRGVGIPTASALLTAWNPREFGIFDSRVVRVLGIQVQDTAQGYVTFRNELLRLKQELPQLRHCALRQIELALWHYDRIQERGTKEWRCEDERAQ